MKRLPYLLVLMILALAACTTTNDAEQAKQAATIDNLKKHVEYLSSDLCEGRKPFSKGAERAVNYLKEEMKAIGLKPINGDSYLQEIPLVLANTQCSEVMTLNTPKGKLDLKHNEGFVAFSKRLKEEISIDKAELVFAGYGIVAPEYGKNDYAGIENPMQPLQFFRFVILIPRHSNSSNDFQGIHPNKKALQLLFHLINQQVDY